MIRPHQAAFTLIELLIVIGIIALLAGMGFGVMSLVRKQAKQAQCTNNLQNLGTAIKAFQLESGTNRFPGRLRHLFDAGNPLSGASKKILICPFDVHQGTNKNMGRPQLSSWGDYSRLWKEEHDPPPATPCSYMYETSASLLDSSEITFFYPRGTIPSAPTYADGKANSILNGITVGRSIVIPRPDAVPIVRDFHHYPWTGSPDNDHMKKVYNLSWSLSVFWSVPKWEDDYQP